MRLTLIPLKTPKAASRRSETGADSPREQRSEILPDGPRRRKERSLAGSGYNRERTTVATQTAASRPGRPLIAVLLIIVALFAWMFGTGHRTPRLGLDLQGGTSITLVPRAASGGGKITSQQVDQAVDIIRQRVNGIGVAEAEVTKQGQGA